jgi:hypothetical protein
MRRSFTPVWMLTLVACLGVAGAFAGTGSGATATAKHALTARHVLQGPAVTTMLSASSTTVGATGVHDTATLAGLTGTTFTGDMVTYTVYPSIVDCMAGTNGTAEGSVTVSGNGAAAVSSTFTPTTAGTYYWQASFNGADHTNAASSSRCSDEPLTVTAATAPTVTTSLSASSTTVGGTGVHDTATLAGLTGTTFTGDMVTYTVYSSLRDCTNGANGTSEGSVTVSGNGAVNASNTFTPASAGTYYWQASFNGADHVNGAASSDCSTEQLSVTTPTTPTLTTTLSATATAVGGAGVFDTATLAGLTGTTFTGDTVTYTVYRSLGDCAAGTNGTSEGTTSVTGNGAVAPSTTFSPTSPGTYYWQASFNGADHTNAAVSSSCSSESLTVTSTQPSQPRGHGRFICRPLFFGRGHHHHRFFICFRIGPHRFFAQGPGRNDLGTGDRQNKGSNWPTIHTTANAGAPDNGGPAGGPGHKHHRH